MDAQRRGLAYGHDDDGSLLRWYVPQGRSFRTQIMRRQVEVFVSASGVAYTTDLDYTEALSLVEETESGDT